MSSVAPKALQDAIEALGNLPGVGPKSAERYAYFLFKNPPQLSQDIAAAIKNLHTSISYCPKTFALIDSDQTYSPLYTSPTRDKKTIAVVADPFDIAAIEKTGAYHGTYHVLGGLISPIDNIGPETLHISELVKRIGTDKVKEVILATNASVEGESTALYISQKLAGHKIKLTRLARGLPIGVDLEYTDQITLARAFEGRQSF